ncbi:MAG TPA: hypothetical protein PLL69_08775, partial [Gemmatimonadales bacterium]|nr:hypothetical protein [Gemmatimonadales bacterium]
MEAVVAHVGQALLQVGHAAQVHGRVQQAGDGAEDVLVLARGVRRLAREQSHQVRQELGIGVAALALQGVEAGRPAVLQREVVAATGAHEDLGLAFLVEEEHRRRGIE